MSSVFNAVFLSYASQDAQAAQRIAEALRSAGIEAWFDQSELRGGDAWDQSIRKQIKTCALFIPVISKHTHERAEGYFRLEWKLAVDRSHLIMTHKAFLLPVVIDDTSDDEEYVPEKFKEVQWTRLPDGETGAAFVDRVKRLLSGEASTPTRGSANAHSGAVGALGTAALAGWSPKRGLLAAVAVLVLGVVAYLAITKVWISKPAGSSPTLAESAAPIAFNPPPHSIAVLPFVNLSGDKEQEYFSDGLTEELLNSLAQINELRVAARASSFSFKEHPDIVTVARKLNVAAVLEGSVRRSERTVRVTAQLINAVTGFHLWSKTYDRDLGDVLELQSEIATAVADALKVTLLGDIAQKIELGGTRNPAAFDAYLRASKLYQKAVNAKDLQKALSKYSEAIEIDPNYALAYADRSVCYGALAEQGGAVRGLEDHARRDAQQALRLAPGLAEAHLAMAYSSASLLEAERASEEFERALALAPGSARVLRAAGGFAVQLGRFEEGFSAIRRAIALDRLNPDSHKKLGNALFTAGRLAEALTAFHDAASLDPDDPFIDLNIGVTNYLMGNLEAARTVCEKRSSIWVAWMCLAFTYDRLGRRADAEAMRARVYSKFGNDGAYGYMEIYAQWGNIPEALKWVETAWRQRDNDLLNMKVDPLLDPLRNEPRFQAVMRELKFPN